MIIVTFLRQLGDFYCQPESHFSPHPPSFHLPQCPPAADLFKKASDILGYDLLARCTEGPKELLDSTEVSQPAIFVASMAAVEKYKMEVRLGGR